MILALWARVRRDDGFKEMSDVVRATVRRTGGKAVKWSSSRGSTVEDLREQFPGPYIPFLPDGSRWAENETLGSLAIRFPGHRIQIVLSEGLRVTVRATVARKKEVYNFYVGKDALVMNVVALLKERMGVRPVDAVFVYTEDNVILAATRPLAPLSKDGTVALLAAREETFGFA